MNGLNIIVLIFACVALMLGLLRLRLLPTVVMKAWFILTVVLIIGPACVGLYLTDPFRYIRVPKVWTQWVCMHLMMYSFTWVTLLNPQTRIDVRFDDPRAIPRNPRRWSDIPTSHIGLCLNHVSMWDIFHVITVVPRPHLINIRTLMKHTLREIPLFGGCFDRVGHFPVYFTKNERECFTVEKEKQAKVNADVEAHLARGGSIAFFPEGAINKNPKVLLPFRYGTFATLFKHRIPIYYMVTVNHDKVWPRTALLGGNAANTRARIGVYVPDYKEERDIKEVVDEMHDYMQETYNDLVEEMTTAGTL